ncbi:hypothetical protein ABH926_010269 [Catenulispora sp. GP43]|uniref:hypothetical protein n=1 Tax=Catenulispora sp. GP43 TaxID=3156263 RepID=UPI003514226D
MSEDDLPRTIIVLLAAFSVVSFAIGSTLEMMRPDLLFRHPYWVNQLSGMTGFTISGFIISVLFRRIQRRHQHRTFAGHAGPEIDQIDQIALEADACMFLRGVQGTRNQPARRDAVLFGRYESMSANAMTTPAWYVPADIREEAQQRVGALVALAEGSGLAEMTEHVDFPIMLARLRRETAVWREDTDAHQLMQITLGRLRELMIGGAHRDFETEIVLRRYEVVAMRPLGIVRSLAMLSLTALEVSSGNRFARDVVRGLGLD